jgi:hypothetical protein
MLCFGLSRSIQDIKKTLMDGNCNGEKNALSCQNRAESGKIQQNDYELFL